MVIFWLFEPDEFERWRSESHSALANYAEYRQAVDRGVRDYSLQGKAVFVVKMTLATMKWKLEAKRLVDCPANRVKVLQESIDDGSAEIVSQPTPIVESFPQFSKEQRSQLEKLDLLKSKKSKRRKKAPQPTEIGDEPDEMHEQPQQVKEATILPYAQHANRIRGLPGEPHF